MITQFEFGVAVREPLKGHTKRVWSVAYSPDGRYIISGSDDMTIQIWDAMTGTAVGNFPKGCTSDMKSVAHSPDGHHIVSASSGEITHDSIPFSSPSNPIHSILYLQPDTNGWVTDPEGGLLYWVPLDCRAGLHSPALLTIPLSSNIRPVLLDFTEFVFGTSWTQVLKCTQS